VADDGEVHFVAYLPLTIIEVIGIGIILLVGRVKTARMRSQNASARPGARGLDRTGRVPTGPQRVPPGGRADTRSARPISSAAVGGEQERRTVVTQGGVVAPPQSLGAAGTPISARPPIVSPPVRRAKGKQEGSGSVRWRKPAVEDLLRGSDS